MYIPLYLQYKNNIGDPWTPPTAALIIYPSSPAGALPVAALRMRSETETLTPCGCPDISQPEDRYGLHATLAPPSEGNAAQLADYLLRFKSAGYRQAKCTYFGLGGFADVELTALDVKLSEGRAQIGFRLASTIVNTIAP